MSVLPWHSTAHARMLGLAERGRLPHALLVAGPAGTGKDWFALCLAAELVGVALPAAASATNPALPAHPDLRRLQPAEGKRQITVDAVRDLVDFAVSRPQGGRWKVAIVSPADAMNANAANALLKTLEEPADNTLLLLVAHRPGGLLPTVRSRCQQLPLPLPDAEQAQAWLADRLPDADIRARALRAAGGAPLAALRLADDGLLDAMAVLERLLSGPVQVSAAADALHGEARWTVLWWARLLAGRLTARQAGQGDGGGVADPPDVAEAHRFLGRLAEARQLLEGTSNPNPRLLLEALFIGWNRLLAGRPIDSA